jgi:serine/threonine protein phosphatase 1
MRLLAIGDIHGCATALETLLNFVNPAPGDQIVTLGDYVDRGPDSRRVLDRLIQLHVAEQLMPLRGNHEIMMLAADQGGTDDLRFWLSCGGVETLESYVPVGSGTLLEAVPQTHWHFLWHTCDDWYETPTHIFVHANLHPELPMNEQTSEYLHWEALSRDWHVPHVSGKTMICGHREQRRGVPLVIDGAICIDTWAYGNGWLTCLDVHSGEYWQANELGRTRRGQL